MFNSGEGCRIFTTFRMRRYSHIKVCSDHVQRYCILLLPHTHAYVNDQNLALFVININVINQQNINDCNTRSKLVSELNAE